MPYLKLLYNELSVVNVIIIMRIVRFLWLSRDKDENMSKMLEYEVFNVLSLIIGV